MYSRYWLALFAFIPSMVLASACIDVPNRIYHDTKKAAASPQPLYVIWMDIHWLQKQLGQPQMIKLPDNKTEYIWSCPDTIGPVVTAILDEKGQMIRVEGQYNLDSGSGMFEVMLPPNIMMRPTKQSMPAREIKPQVTTTKIVTVVPDTKKMAMIDNNAATCQNITQQIYEDILKYDIKNSKKKRNLSWMNLAWLQVKLGKPDISTINETLYNWDNYQLLDQANGSQIKIGQLPQNQTASTADEIIKILGQPKDTIHFPLTKYTWKCQNYDSSLNVITNEKGVIIYIDVKSCQDKNCRSTDITLRESEAVKTLRTQLDKALENEKTQVVSQAITLYNQRFHTTFTTEKELSEDMTKRMKNYYQSIRECKMGNYEIAVPVMTSLAFSSSHIKGMNAGRCEIENQSEFKNEKFGSGTIVTKCEYTPASLALFTEQRAEAISQGKASYDSNNLTPIQQAIKNECKNYVNGQLMQ